MDCAFASGLHLVETETGLGTGYGAHVHPIREGGQVQADAAILLQGLSSTIVWIAALFDTSL